MNEDELKNKKNEEEIEETELIEEELDETKLLEEKPSAEETTMKPLFKAYLLCIDGPLLGRKFPLRFDITKIGRSEGYNDIILEGDRKASRRHATIISKGGEYVIYDKRSRNRTYVNRIKLNENDQFVLKPGDEIEIGSNIFRFIKEGEEDFAPPRKAGSFWLRWKLKMLRIGSTVGIFIFAYLSYCLLNDITIATQKPSPLEIRLLNKKETEIRVEKNFYNYHSPLALLKVPKQKNNAIAICQSGSITILNGNTLGVLNIIKSELLDDTKGITIADLNQDKIKDLVVVTKDSKVAVYDCYSGMIMWQSDFLGGDLFPPLVGNLNNDAYSDFVVVSRDGKVYFGDIVSGKLEFRFYPIKDTLPSSGCIGDVDGDGQNEVIVISEIGRVYFLDGTKVELKDQIDVADKLARITGIKPEFFQVLSNCAVGEINNKKGEDFVVFSRQGQIIAFDGTTKEIIWQDDLFNKFGPAKRLHLKYSPPILTDLNSDGSLDVILALLNGYMLGMNGIDGKVLWAFQLDENELVVSTPALADIDKDGTPDIIFGCEPSGIIYVLNGNNGKLLFKSSPSGSPITFSPVIGDINGDNFIDFVIINNLGEMLVFKTNAKIKKDKILWEMENCDAKRSNVYYLAQVDIATLRSRLIVFIGIIIGLLVINGLFLAKERKRLKMFKT